MTNSQTARFDINTRLIKTAAALTSVGLMMATAGMGLASITVARAARTWLREREISPAAVAAAKLHQAKEASVAGVHAWRTHSSNGVGAGVNAR